MITFETARDAMYGVVKTAWDANAAAIAGYVPTIYYDGVGTSSDPDPDEHWAEANIRHTTGTQATLSRRRFEKRGIITVSVFANLTVAGGLREGELLAAVAKEALEGVDTPEGVWFRNTRIQEVGASKTWYQFNVISEFVYDEVGI